MKSSPLGWLLGIAAIVAATRASLGGDGDDREIVARKITVGAPGSRYRITLEASGRGSEVRLVDNEKSNSVSLLLDDRGARIDMHGQAGITLSVEKSHTGSEFLDAAVVSLSSNTAGKDTPYVQFMANPLFSSVRATAWGFEDSLLVSRTADGPFSCLSVGQESTLDSAKKDVFHPSVSICGSAGGSGLDVRDASGAKRIQIGYSPDDSDKSKWPVASIRLLDDMGRPAWSAPATAADASATVPLYIPTLDSVRPPPKPDDPMGAAVLGTWNEWIDAFSSVEEAVAALKTPLPPPSGASTPQSTERLVAQRDDALKACLVIKRRFVALGGSIPPPVPK